MRDDIINVRTCLLASLSSLRSISTYHTSFFCAKPCSYRTYSLGCCRQKHWKCTRKAEGRLKRTWIIRKTPLTCIRFWRQCSNKRNKWGKIFSCLPGKNYETMFPEEVSGLEYVLDGSTSFGCLTCSCAIVQGQK